MNNEERDDKILDKYIEQTDKMLSRVELWHEKHEMLINQYNEAIAKLDKAVNLVEKSKKTWWVVYRTPILAVGIILLIVLLNYFGLFCGSMEFFGFGSYTGNACG